MTEEQTLIIIKPDGVSQKHIGHIITRIENKGYSVDQLAVVKATRQQLATHYHELVDKPFYPELEKYMLSSKLVVLVASGHNIVEVVHEMAGATDPDKAVVGSIRGDFGRSYTDGVMRNVVHTSDSVENAKREIAIWFK